MRIVFPTALLAGLMIAVVGCAPAQAAAWPEVPTPPGARVQVVAGDMSLNGRPCRVLRVDSDIAADEVLDFYRRRFGSNVAVEHRMADKRILATRQADFFTTVQIRPTGERSAETTVMTARMLPQPVQSAASNETERLLPTDTAIVSNLQARDAGRRSLTVVGINKHAVQANRDHLVAALRARGFEVRSESSAANTAGSIWVLLVANGEEVILSISDAGAYRAILINRAQVQS
ncbi:MAG TPA: hypothetical protein VF169_04455 [Albitalea sp.]|uniref:hypothetical protein n=1 Tax=Piscinibacter sp. TaxID=1903157 RepID=UPI002ED28BAA